MFAGIKELLLGLTKVAGVEASLLPEGIVYNLVILEKKKSLISVISKEEEIKELSALVNLIPKGIPISLSVNGRGIINRKIQEGTYRDDAEVLSQVFPNAKMEDFYLQKYPSGNKIFLSVVRKNVLDDINDQFLKSGLPVINVSTGPFIAQAIAPFVDEKVDKIYSGAITLSIKDKMVDDFAANSEGIGEEINIGEEKIKSSFIIPYALGLVMFMGLSDQYSINAPLIILQKEEFKNKVIFKTVGYGLLGFFVVVLMVNYFIYNYYKSENAKLSSITTSYSNTLEEVKDLQKKIGEKEYFMKKAGWLSVPKTSFYSDEIAASIPHAIKLSALKVNPLNEKISKKERKDIFRTDTIIVAGICNNPAALNPWMNGLKENKWIESLSHLNYTYDNKTGSGNFEIEIRIGNEISH